MAPTRTIRNVAASAALAGTVALWVFLANAAAETAPRIALVMGNGGYDPGNIARLDNPVSDARLMASTLEGLGFDVSLIIDADRDAMELAVEAFGKRLRRAGGDAVGLFYYAGHGVEAAGQNYLIPLGAKIESSLQFGRSAVPAQYVLEWMEHAGNQLNMVILDACRNNPFGEQRGGMRGLAPMKGPSGTLIAYSAGPGEAASDGDYGNSPYTLALAETMIEPGLQVEDVFKRVRLRVEQATGNEQTPWENSSLTGYFYFVPADPTPPPPPPPDPAARAYEVAESIHTTAAYQAVVDHYGDSIFAEFAAEQIRTLSQARAPELVEGSLGLERAEQRLIELGLASTGFDPGPPDGLFGEAMREALRSWQNSRGDDATGWLTESEASELRTLGEEAERKRLEAAAPGVYLSIDVSAGQMIAPGHLRVIQPARISDGEIRGYPMIASGCYSAPLSVGDRLGWSDIAVYCSP